MLADKKPRIDARVFLDQPPDKIRGWIVRTLRAENNLNVSMILMERRPERFAKLILNSADGPHKRNAATHNTPDGRACTLSPRKQQRCNVNG